MAMAEYRMGALHVVQQLSDKDWINRRLRYLDPNLFVEEQITFDNEHVWCVVENRPPERGGPITVYEFRDRQGRPIPALSDWIVEEMQKRANRDPAKIMAGVDARNAQREAARKARMREDLETSVSEFEVLKRRSPTVARSVGLRQARERGRKKGIAK